MKSTKLLKPILNVGLKSCTNRKHCATAALSEKRNYSTVMSILAREDCTEKNNLTYAKESMKTNTKSYKDIPGPKELPLIGNAWRFAPVIGQYKIHELDKVMWSLYKNYGNIVKVGGLIGHPDLLFVFNGEDIQRVFRQEETLPHRPSMPSLHYYKQHLQKDFFIGNEGVIGVHGIKWDAFRKQVQQVLLPPAAAKAYIDPLNVIAGDFLKRMELLLDSNKELPENFLSEIYKWALESVARVALDRRLGCLEPDLTKDSESQKIIDAINTFFWNVAEVELKMPVWRLYKNKAFRKYISALDDFRMLCMKYISDTMETMKTKDYANTNEENVSIVERILLKTGNPKLAAVLALDLLLVGVDTTSIALASTIYQLTQNLDAQEKLYKELKEVMDKDGNVTANVQEKIPFLKACVKETLRMYPVIIGNGRSLQSDTVISGYGVPKGTHVIFPHLIVSNVEEYFKDAASFVPERWIKGQKVKEAGCPLSQNNSNNNKIHPFASLPFGYGRRSCLGRRFAEAELYILLAKIFRKYKVEFNYGKLTYKITPTYVPEQPLRFKLIERDG